MMRRRRWLTMASLVAAFALVAAACGDSGTSETTSTTAPPVQTTTTTEGTTTTSQAPETTTTQAGSAVALGPGVTEEPCPDSEHPDRGCIYLGVLSDLSAGPFAPVAIPLTQAQEDFWAWVNSGDGINGLFDVAITPDTTADTFYDPAQHVEGYVRIEPNVAMLAQSLGTPQTQAALERMKADNMVAAPATWWSGWAFDAVDGGLILESGSPYCFEAMNAVDFTLGAREGPFTYAIVAFPGDYGGDWAAGVKIAAANTGLGDPVAEVLQIPISAGGDVTEAVTTLAGTTPDVVFIITGPTEMAQIMGGTFQAGHQTAMYVGAGPTWNVGLLQQEALLPLLQQAYFLAAPWGSWATDSEGHTNMRAAADASGTAPSTGYTAGWAFQYPVKALLETAVSNGDMTREGQVAAAASLTGVDYQGMLPARDYVGDPNETVPRSTIIGRVDPTAPDGITAMTEFFAGPNASAFDFSAPCFAG